VRGRPALDVLAADQASSHVDDAWRCATCGCDRLEAGRRATRRARALPRNAVTCGEAVCKRERECQVLKEKYGPGTLYYEAARRKRRRQTARGSARR
jgi:hypothetical protein